MSLRKALAESTAHSEPSDVASTLRTVIAEFIDPDSDGVGHALPVAGDLESTGCFEHTGVHNCTWVSSVNAFAAALIKAAAVLGADRVSDLVAGWSRGQPLTYHTVGVVPVAIAKAIAPTDRVDLVPLPMSTDKLPAWLPLGKRIDAADYLGQTVFSVETVAKPALFRPESDRNRRLVRAEPCFAVDTILEALSLTSNMSVEKGLCFNDYGELAPLVNRAWWGTLQPRAGLGQWSLSTDYRTGVRTLKLRDGASRDIPEGTIRTTLKGLEKHAKTNIPVAVARWKKSMVRGDLVDQFIDLRIALESLFLSQGQELSFRLAVSGAWLLGKDASDRRRVWDILRRAYKASSAAVHQGKLKRTKENCALLAEAQTLCRVAITHVLRHGPVTDWDGLILGRSSDRNRSCFRRKALSAKDLMPIGPLE